MGVDSDSVEVLHPLLELSESVGGGTTTVGVDVDSVGVDSVVSLFPPGGVQTAQDGM